MRHSIHPTLHYIEHKLVMDYDQPFVAKASTRSILVHDQLLASVFHICIEMCQEMSAQVTVKCLLLRSIGNEVYTLVYMLQLLIKVCMVVLTEE